MNRWKIGVVLLSACGSPGGGTKDSGADPTTPVDTADTVAVDPVVEKLGGCTAAVVWAGDEVEDYQGTLEYDANGDLVAEHWSYRSPYGDFDTDVIRTFDAPHEVAEEETTITQGAYAVVTLVRSRWTDGRLALQTYSIDGAVQWNRQFTWDADGLPALFEWDFDDDAVFEHDAAYVWAADGLGGWTGSSTGTDPGGAFSTTEHADADARVDDYHRLDDRGSEENWTHVGRNELGNYAEVARSVVSYGDLMDESVEEHTFDADGRELHVDVTDHAAIQASYPPDWVQVVVGYVDLAWTIDSTWTCP